MKLKNKYILLTILFLSVLFFGLYKYLSTPRNWQFQLDQVGTNSSCRATDLNGDGILDIVLGAGGKEYQVSAYGVIAIDGKDGTLLWKIPCRNQVVGSSVFNDITGDGVDDVFIGGRSAQLIAINGKTGTVLWEYLPSSRNLDLENDTTLLNFFNPQWVPDFDNDGINDLLVSFGGFVKATANDLNRPAGKLLIIGSRSGKVLGSASMPDGSETYMSPVVHDFDGDGILSVIFGSGGETINGGLYKVDLTAILHHDISHAKKLADGDKKGFISPPVLIDITSDGILDIVTNSFDGRMMAFDGASDSLLWQYQPSNNIETYSCVAPLDADEDGIADFFSSYGVGAWPQTLGAIQIVVNGKTGKEMMRNTLGSFQYASPIVYDFTNDGHEDVLFTINTSSKPAFEDDGEENRIRFYTELIVFDLKNKTHYRIGERQDGTNLGSTPLLVDVDRNGTLDLVTCRMTNAFDFFGFDGFVIEKLDTRMRNNYVRWGEYMGPGGRCIYDF